MTSLLDRAPEADGTSSYVAVFGTALAHGALVALAWFAGTRGVSQLKKLLPVTEMVEVALPEPAPAAPVPVAAPATAPRMKLAAPTPATPPPSAAQAGQVLDAKSDTVDFGDNFVTGSGNAYAGGVTDSQGTSTNAVRDAKAQGDSAGLPARPIAPAVDLSRPPRLAGSAQWQCPFPIEADDAGLDHAAVTLRVDVDAQGGVRAVATSSDPGNGFGREARRCASSKRWLAALDRSGHPIDGLAIVNVRFDR